MEQMFHCNGRPVHADRGEKARPNFMKIAPIIDALKAAEAQGSSLRYRLIHIGQHYDRAMSGGFFESLGVAAREGRQAQSLLATIHGLLTQFKGAAEQLKTTSVWQLVCEHILSTIARYKPKIPDLLSPPTSALDSLNCFF